MSNCIICNGVTNETIRVNEFDGFCHSSRTENVCEDCSYEKPVFTKVGSFLKLNNKLYYDKYETNTYELVSSKGQLDKIFNKDYYNVLELL